MTDTTGPWTVYKTFVLPAEGYPIDCSHEDNAAFVAAVLNGAARLPAAVDVHRHLTPDGKHLTLFDVALVLDAIRAVDVPAAVDSVIGKAIPMPRDVPAAQPSARTLAAIEAAQAVTDELTQWTGDAIVPDRLLARLDQAISDLRGDVPAADIATPRDATPAAGATSDLTGLFAAYDDTDEAHYPHLPSEVRRVMAEVRRLRSVPDQPNPDADEPTP